MGGGLVRLPGLTAYYDRAAENYVNYKIRCREDREREAERVAPGPVFRYVPYAGIYMMMNEAGSFMGYVDRMPDGAWVPAEPVPLLAGV